MSRWRKTEHFGWPGNHDQCQEINRVGCLPLLGFSFLALHIAPFLTVFEEWCRSPGWKQALKEKGVSRGACSAWRDLWEQDGMGVRRTAGGALGLSHTWRWDGKSLWSGDFLRSSFFMDLCSLMRNTLNFIQNKKKRKKGRTETVQALMICGLGEERWTSWTWWTTSPHSHHQS